jgi:hypothetical protein
MLPTWITRFVLALALAVLPLQGFAQTIQVLLCHPQSAAPAHSTGGDGHVAHDHGAEAGHTQPGGHEDASDSSPGPHGSHFCCDLAGAAALPSFARSFADARCARVAVAPDTSHASTYPELPQRPPLA